MRGHVGKLRQFLVRAVELLHLLQKLRFGVLAGGDVVHRHRQQGALGGLQAAQHDLHGESASILAASMDLDPPRDVPRVASSRDSEVVRDHQFHGFLRQQAPRGPPHQLIAAVSELSLRLQVHEDDLPGQGHQHHRIGSRLEQPAVPALHLSQMLFCVLAHADVADGRRHQDSLRAIQWAQADLDGELGAILAQRE